MPAKPTKPAGETKVDCGSPFFVVSQKGTTQLEVCKIISGKGTPIGRGIMVDQLLRTLAGVKSKEAADWAASNAVGKTREQIKEAPLEF